LLYKPSYRANFGLKFPKFRCHGNKGQSGLNFNDTVKLSNPVNPQFGARCSVIISYITPDTANCVEIPQFSLPWQPGSRGAAQI